MPVSLLWSVPWAHHVVLMDKVPDLVIRRWYMEQTLAHGWSRNILALQIDTQSHIRQGKAVTNFDKLLPAPQSDLAKQTLKDPYIFDFLTLAEPFHERELETSLIRHLEKFLLELGSGFAFVGRQYRLEVGGEDFYIDLLFYHLGLRAFVVIDLKKGAFKPEYAGKLNFYCNVVNDRLRHPSDQPTIGLILCQTRDKLLAEYSFAGPLSVKEEVGTYFAKGQRDVKPGDRRVGVVWHTQGSGKSLTMAFYAGRVVLHPAMENPTLVIITDRNDLDDQLYGTFARCHELLRQKPVQAQSRANLRELLRTGSGGVVFTTVHKFFPTEGEDQHPLLSDRQNIVVIADEAHRSQYDFIDGFARHMREALPNASFIGFTGTPIELTDKNTRAVFGDYISIYDIERAVKDGATVPIYYESRLAKLELNDAERPKLDEEFEEATEGEEIEHKERLKTRWAQLEALVGTEKRIKLIAEDLVKHFERRLEAMDGKAMVVCMSRRICVELYNAITAIRPDWHHSDDDKGILKVVMTGSASDPVPWQPHIRNKPRREELAKRFKDPVEPFKVVIVRDMWLTGFDAPCLHTMYVDKPMRGHGLMQAIARVNRVFKDKPGGLVVDYLGLADQLKYALASYTESDKGQTAINQEEAVATMLERYEVCCDIFHGFDWSPWKTGGPQGRLSVLPAAQEHVLVQDDGKNRLVKAVTELSKAFALAVPHEKALEIRDDVAFFQAVKSVLTKGAGIDRRSPEEIEHAIRQIVSRAVASDEVIDIFAAAGLKKPDISILSDEFLAEIRGLPQRNLAVEMLRKLLEGEIKTRGKKNIVQARSFAEMLENAIRRYQNRAIETAQVIEELIALARDLREADHRGEKLGLTEDEIAFYDALEANDSAVKVLGDETLRIIAQELLRAVRNNVTIDWTVRENVRAQMRVMIKRILRRYGYPPDRQARATELVLEQAEVLCRDWAEKV